MVQIFKFDFVVLFLVVLVCVVFVYGTSSNVNRVFSLVKFSEFDIGANPMPIVKVCQLMS